MGGSGTSGALHAPPPEEARPAGRSLALNSSAVFVITVLVQLLGYIPTYFLSHGLGRSPSGEALWGEIQFFLLLATSVSSLGDLRIGTAFTYFVSRGDSPRRATTTYLIIRLVMVLFGGILLWVFRGSLGISAVSAAEIFAVWMALPLLWSASTVYQNLWASLGDSAKAQYPVLLESIIRAAGLAFVAITFLSNPTSDVANSTQTLWEMTAAYVVGAAAGTIVCLPSIIRYRGTFRLGELSRMLRWSWPLLGSMTLLYLSGNLINFVVIYFLHYQLFNFFNAANAFRTLALALPAAIAVPLFPHISSLHKEEAFGVIRSRTWQTLRYTAMLVVPGVMALVVYRVNVLNILYVGNYTVAAPALAILALSAIPASLSQIIGTTMTSIGRTRLEFYITSLQIACLSVVSVALLAHPGPLAAIGTVGLTGLNGAAMAVLVSSSAALLLNSYFLLRLLGVRFQLVSMVTIVASALASFFAVSRFNALLPVNRYYQLAAGVLIGFAVYFVVLALIGELSKEDLRMVLPSVGLPTRLTEALARFCWKVSARPVNPLPPGGAAGLVSLESQWVDAAPPSAEEPSGGRTPPLP